jgi:membrane protein implicated in regulation of membrane protease activity
MRTKRGIGLIVVGCLLASLAVLGLVIAWLGSAQGTLAGLLMAAAVIGTYVQLRRWRRRWGATDDEVRCNAR